MRKGLGAALAAALAAGCQAERTSGGGRDAFDAAGGGGRREAVGDVGIPVPPRARPEDVVVVPEGVFAPVGDFLDGEGMFLGDRVEIDASYEPFMGRFVSLCKYGEGKSYVRWEESDDAATGVKTIRLLASEGPKHLATFVPRVTFPSPREIPKGEGLVPEGKDPVRTFQELSPEERARLEAVMRPATRPTFEFVGTEELTIRFHMRPDPRVPVFFRARALGTPPPQDPRGAPRECTYAMVREGRAAYRHRAPVLELGLEIRMSPDGTWKSVVREPGRGGGAGEGAAAR